MRKLTGKWYLKRRFFGGYKVMVEVIIDTGNPYDFFISPRYELATVEDLHDLNIIIL